MNIADPVVGSVQPRPQVAEDKVEDWQKVRRELRVAPIGGGPMCVAPLSHRRVTRPVDGVDPLAATAAYLVARRLLPLCVASYFANAQPPNALRPRQWQPPVDGGMTICYSAAIRGSGTIITPGL